MYNDLQWICKQNLPPFIHKLFSNYKEETYSVLKVAENDLETLYVIYIINYTLCIVFVEHEQSLYLSSANFIWNREHAVWELSRSVFRLVRVESEKHLL